MKISLTHIFRNFTIVFLLAGFAAHTAAPFFGDMQKNAFTQWLDHKVVAGDNELSDDLRDRIRELPKEAGNFWMLIQDASKLISEHEENFEITPFTSQREHEQVSTWLIGQWSTYKHQQNIAKAVLPKIMAPVYKWLTLITSFYATPSELITADMPEIRGSIFSAPIATLSLFSPSSSGISINAP